MRITTDPSPLPGNCSNQISNIISRKTDNNNIMSVDMVTEEFTWHLQWASAFLWACGIPPADSRRWRRHSHAAFLSQSLPIRPGRWRTKQGFLRTVKKKWFRRIINGITVLWYSLQLSMAFFFIQSRQVLNIIAYQFQFVKKYYRPFTARTYQSTQLCWWYFSCGNTKNSRIFLLTTIIKN